METQLELRATQGRDEVDADFTGDVRAFGTAAGAPTTPTRAAEQISEQVADAAGAVTAGAGRAEQIFDVDRAAAATTAAAGVTAGTAAISAGGLGIEALAQALFAELVVQAALLFVGERLIGAVHVLEAGLGLLVARVFVGVELRGELAIRLLDLVVGGAGRDP